LAIRTFISEICYICLLSPRIPLACEDGFAANGFKSLANAANASEQIDESEGCFVVLLFTDFSKNIAEGWFNVERQRNLAVFPARDGLSVHVELFCKHVLGKMFTNLH
jgi:hypothetical protein